MYVMVGIYNVGLIFSFLRLDNDALESYRTCRWYYDRDREIFHRSAPLPAQRFVYQSARDEEDRILASIAADKESRRHVDLPKTRTSLNQEDIFDHIDNIWAHNPESTGASLLQKDPRDARKEANFGLILASARCHLGAPGSDSKRGFDRSVATMPAGSVGLTTPGETTRPRIMSRSASGALSPKQLLMERERQKKEKDEETEAEDKKMLNPDQYFKTRICGDMQIDTHWLEETDPRKRFRQDMIQNIVSSERNSNKSVKILREFLMIKRRDRPIPDATEADPKAIQKQAFYEIGHRMYSLEKSVGPLSVNEAARKVRSQRSLPAKKPSRHSVFMLRSPSTCVQSPQSFSRPSTTFLTEESPVRLEQERKRMMTTVAEQLQRDIFRLERVAAKKKCWQDCTSTKQSTNKRKERREQQQEAAAAHQSLAGSVIKRAKEETAMREQHSKAGQGHVQSQGRVKPPVRFSKNLTPY